MNFKYSIVLQWSSADEGYIALVPEFAGLSGFGRTPEEAVAEARVAAEMFVEELAEEGRPAPPPDLLVPASGQLRLRMPKSLHRNLAIQAAKEGISLNSYIVDRLTERTTIRELLSEFRQTVGVQAEPQVRATYPVQRNDPLYMKERSFQTTASGDDALSFAVH